MFSGVGLLKATPSLSSPDAGFIPLKRGSHWGLGGPKRRVRWREVGPGVSPTHVPQPDPHDALRPFPQPRAVWGFQPPPPPIPHAPSPTQCVAVGQAGAVSNVMWVRSRQGLTRIPEECSR